MGKLFSKPSEFYTITTDLLSKLNKNKIPVPLSEDEISKIKLVQNRTGLKTIDLPRSIQVLLSLDKNFTINNNYFNQPLFKFFFDRMDENNIVHSARISDELIRFFDGFDLKGNNLLWNDTEEMPALIELYSPGDQRVYMYMGVPDNDNEFPIARYDNQPEVWISASSLIQYILSSADTSGVFDLKADFDSMLEHATHRNEPFISKEWWHKDFEFPQ